MCHSCLLSSEFKQSRHNVAANSEKITPNSFILQFKSFLFLSEKKLRLFICIRCCTVAASPSVFLLLVLCHTLMFASYIKHLACKLALKNFSKTFHSISIILGAKWQPNDNIRFYFTPHTNGSVGLCFSTVIHRRWTHTQVWCKVLHNVVPSIAVSSYEKSIDRTTPQQLDTNPVHLRFIQLLQLLSIQTRFYF